jgi:D-beta-D-heptose 7-phosphate kinase / D-beta-D-heptose 1-phosphate adenosyltransferase
MFYTISSIKAIAQKLHKSQKKIVLATGFFDLLHNEHINFLQKSRAAGDTLIVAVESVRLEHLIAYADYLIALGADFNNPVAFENLIASVRPTILAVSSHTAHQDKKQALVAKYGGNLQIVHTHNQDVSTTQLIKKGGV